ncbi:MAG: sugar phosphate isomerase/epimerase [Clostridia bacterium]|nr:sugar phosphate isomerase/epimerase [Clostridia bacterium]
MNIGVIVPLGNYEREFEKMREIGILSCQFNAWDDSSFLTEELAEKVKKKAEECGITVTAVWRGWSGPKAWNFTEGPTTLGLVPREYRKQRIADLKVGSDFAKVLGVGKVITHMGFLPEFPGDPEYPAIVEAIREVAEYCKERGQYLLFETGQETPVTLLRTIEAVGTGNLGINLDPANLILYGKANPVDALDVFGKYVMELHGKDGLYPTTGSYLGSEVRIGDGKVCFERLIPRLHEVGFDGTITIEREIDGEEQIKDIIFAKEFLENLISLLPAEKET